MSSKIIDEAYEYCQRVTRQHARSFYFASSFLPFSKRRAVYPIYAFCRHVDDEIDEPAENGNVAEAIAAVERWRARLGEVFSGEAMMMAEMTPEQRLVMIAWQDLLGHYRIPHNLPLELIEGVLMDTNVTRFETFDELYVYCYRVASTVGLMSSEILGYDRPDALAKAEAMGVGMQLTNILRDIREDAERGRIYLPQEDLKRFGVTEEQIFEGYFDGNFDRLMRFQIDRARHYYALGEEGIGMLERDSRFTVMLASRVYGRILDEIEKLNRNVFLARAHTSTTRKIVMIPGVWRAARRVRT